MSEPLTDDEINRVLERFDQTEPTLQRQIVATMTLEIALNRRKLEMFVELVEFVQFVSEYHGKKVIWAKIANDILARVEELQ